MTEAFMTIGSSNFQVKTIAGWLEIGRKVSSLCGYDSYTNGTIRKIFGGILPNDLSDSTVNAMILEMLTAEEKRLVHDMCENFYIQD